MSHTRSVYLSDEENELVEQTADEKNMAINYVLRVAVRYLFGLPLSTADRDLARRATNT